MGFSDSFFLERYVCMGSQAGHFGEMENIAGNFCGFVVF
jgi:hypothetical protein